MLTATKDLLLPTTVTGSWPRPSWFTGNLFERPFSCHPIGLINDDRVPVGRVHLGIVYLVAASDAGVRIREKDLLSGRFAQREELRPVLPLMESWSRLVAEALFFNPPSDSLSPGPGSLKPGD